MVVAAPGLLTRRSETIVGCGGVVESFTEREVSTKLEVLVLRIHMLRTLGLDWPWALVMVYRSKLTVSPETEWGVNGAKQ